MYEIKLKDKPQDREFLVIFEDDYSATVEFDTWNKCPDPIYDKYNKDKRFEFRTPNGQTISDISYPQNRQVRDNMSMASYKRSVKIEGGEK